MIAQESVVRKILADVSKIKDGSYIQRREQRRVADTAQLQKLGCIDRSAG
jgi:hypothetical protein